VRGGTVGAPTVGPNDPCGGDTERGPKARTAGDQRVLMGVPARLTTAVLPCTASAQSLGPRKRQPALPGLPCRHQKGKGKKIKNNSKKIVQRHERVQLNVWCTVQYCLSPLLSSC